MGIMVWELFSEDPLYPKIGRWRSQLEDFVRGGGRCVANSCVLIRLLDNYHCVRMQARCTTHFRAIK